MMIFLVMAMAVMIFFIIYGNILYPLRLRRISKSNDDRMGICEREILAPEWVKQEILESVSEVSNARVEVNGSARLVSDLGFDPREIEDILEEFTKRHQLTFSSANPMLIPENPSVDEVACICYTVFQKYQK